MSYELDMSQYRDLFLQEAREQLEILEQETLKLEKDPTDNRLQVIFRAAHTLKGSARAMGFHSFAELTHEMENVLDKLRHGELEVTTLIADSILSCSDTLKSMTDAIESGQSDEVEFKELVQMLKSFEPGETVTEPCTQPAAETRSSVPEEINQALQVLPADVPVWRAQFKLEADCAMKFVRAFMAVSEVQKGGELLASVPNGEDLEEEKFEQEFELYFTWNEDPEQLKAAFSKISEVESFDLSVVQRNHESSTKAESVHSKVELKEIAKSATNTPAPASAPKKGSESGQTVRVDVSRLDMLMNLVGELVIDRTRIAQIGSELGNRYHDDNIDALAETVSHIHRITSDLQDQIMKARMLPIETVFNRFPRVVRDLAQKLGKDITLEVEGGETELDRSVIEVIGDPLLHILRNSVDHGVEMPEDRARAGKPSQGTIRLTAKHQENHIVIEIIDDGKGIDSERVKAKAIENGLVSAEAAERLSEKEVLQFIFASGLSTAKEVSDVSGRGVGMDIVRSNILKLGGIIDLESEVGVGTKFSLRLPLTLAIIRGLLVEASANVYVIPLGSVVETLLINRKQVQTVNRKDVVVIRGLTTPLVHLNNYLVPSNSHTVGEKSDQIYIVVVGLAEERVGIVVDSLIGEREVVIKSLSRFCGEVQGISGATILGDGNVALIMDVNGVVALNKAA